MIALNLSSKSAVFKEYYNMTFLCVFIFGLFTVLIALFFHLNPSILPQVKDEFSGVFHKRNIDYFVFISYDIFSSEYIHWFIHNSYVENGTYNAILTIPMSGLFLGSLKMINLWWTFYHCLTAKKKLEITIVY